MLGYLLSLSVAPSEPIVLDGMLCHPNRLMVKLDSAKAAEAIEGRGFRILRRMPEIGWVSVEVPRGRLQASRRTIRDLPGVNAADLDRAARLAYDPNDALWSEMWHMRAIRANLAWDQSFGSSEVVVAIMDTGLKWDHPDLIDNAWTNAGEIPANGIDDDGNGYIDDVHGYDFGYGDSDPNDVHGHGTSCAGLVAATQDNTIGVTGVAPRAKLMGLKASIDSGYFYDSANVPAYLYAAQMGAKVVSCSFFSDRVSQSERDAIDFIWSQGVLPVVAAGNDNTIYPYYPAAYENSLAVGAVNNSLLKASFSNFGSWVDVAAPGTSLRTTTTGGYTTGFGGTSGACPHVAGLAALIIGTYPSATAQEVRNAIEDTASPTIQAPFGEWTNYGLVRADDALSALNLPTAGRTPVVRYMTPAAVSSADPLPPSGYHQARIYGRGFQLPRTVEVKFGGVPTTLLSQTRDYVDVVLPTGSATAEVRVDGVLVKQFSRPPAKKKIYPLIEASTEGASLTGGFTEALNTDNSPIVVTRRSDGKIYMECVFRKVDPFNPGTLYLRRRYPGLASGTEKVYMYRWANASFPYGTFTQISQRTVSDAWSLEKLKIPRAVDHIDPEGTMYFYIEVTNVPEGAKLEMDLFQIWLV